MSFGQSVPHMHANSHSASLTLPNDMRLMLSCIWPCILRISLPLNCRDRICNWINELANPDARENALLELSKKRESVPDLAPMLWHSFGMKLIDDDLKIFGAARFVNR